MISARSPEQNSVRMVRSFIGPVSVALVLLVTLLAWGVRLYHTRFEASSGAAATWVTQHFAPGDVVVTTPEFIATLQPQLGHLPLLAMHAPTTQTELANRLTGYRRVHLLTLDAVGASHELSHALAPLAVPSATTFWPGIELATYTLNHPTEVTFDLFESLSQVQVEVRYAQQDWQPCGAWRGRKFSCPRDPGWNYVGQEWFDLGNVPTRCVWMHPVKKDEALRIHLPTLANAKRLLLTYGFNQYGARFAVAPVNISVLAGDQLLWQGQQPLGSSRSSQWVVLPDESTQTITLEVTSNNNGAAHFCLNAQAVRP